jgi:hypothetical protein
MKPTSKQDAEARALGPAGAAALLVGAALVLAALAVLRSHGWFDTGFWNVDNGIRGGRFVVQLLTLLAGLVALQWTPQRWARWIIYGEGAICLGAYGLIVGGIYIATLAAYFVALELPLPKPLRVALPVVWVGTVGVFAGHWLPLPLRKTVFVFSVLFHVRMLVYAWEKWQSGFPRGRIGDYALYFLSPPLVVFPPYVGIIPFFGRHAARFAPRLNRARGLLGMRHLGWGLFHSLLFLAMKRLSSDGQIGGLAFLQVYWLFLLQLTQIAGLMHVVYGLLVLHGFVDRPPIARPLTARTYVEFWQRFPVHQKDLQVAVFYNPVLLRMRRRSRYLAIAAAVAAPMFFGNFALHYVVRYVYDWQHCVPRLSGLILFFGASFVVLTASLWVAEWRTRAKVAAPTGVFGYVWTAASWWLTFSFTAHLMLV